MNNRLKPESPLKLCMVAYTYYSSDPRVRREAEALVEAGFIVDIISLREESKSPAVDMKGIKVLSVPIKRRRVGFLDYIFSYLFFFVIATLIVSYSFFRNRYDLIHVHNMPDFLVFCAILPKLLGSKIVLDVHDPMSELYSTIFGVDSESVMGKFMLLQSRLSFRFADRLITVHQGMRELINGLGVNASKVEVVHNLPDSKIFGKAKAAPLSGELFTIIYAGTISQRHGLDVVIEAINLLSDEMPNIRLKILGDGPDVNRLKSLVDLYKITDKVIFGGVVPLDSVPGHLALSDCCVAPYAKDPYGNLVFPTKVLESFMVGLPVICSRTPTVMKYLDESMLFLFDTSDPIDLANQIQIISSNGNLVDRKLRCAESFLKQMNWDIEKKKLVKCIQNIYG